MPTAMPDVSTGTLNVLRDRMAGGTNRPVADRANRYRNSPRICIDGCGHRGVRVVGDEARVAIASSRFLSLTIASCPAAISREFRMRRFQNATSVSDTTAHAPRTSHCLGTRPSAPCESVAATPPPTRYRSRSSPHRRDTRGQAPEEEA